MATEIRNIPVLEGEAAERFERMIETNELKLRKDYSENIRIMNEILNKAKL